MPLFNLRSANSKTTGILVPVHYRSDKGKDGEGVADVQVAITAGENANLRSGGGGVSRGRAFVAHAATASDGTYRLIVPETEHGMAGFYILSPEDIKISDARAHVGLKLRQACRELKTTIPEDGVVVLQNIPREAMFVRIYAGREFRYSPSNPFQHSFTSDGFFFKPKSEDEIEVVMDSTAVNR